MNKSKCQFVKSQLEYLGHGIFVKGIYVDPIKIDGIKAWPMPISVKALRGFLGLTGYYWHCFHHYRVLTKPLADLH